MRHPGRFLFHTIFLPACALVAMAGDTPRPPVDAAGWSLAVPGWKYEFPRDHANHPGFKTEWWYFTGNLESADNRRFGYQLTFFRQGIRPPGAPAAASRFVISDLPFAHFAITDIDGKKFHFAQKASRGAFGEAGFEPDGRLAWIDSWACEAIGPHAFRLRADGDGFAADLTLTNRRDPVFHGSDGISTKSAGTGRASHYYSLTRLETRGRLTIGDTVHEVNGWTWFDHEWATNQLAAHQTGWDWFSLQFEDGSDLMLFQIRTRDGGRDEFSGGTFVTPDGRTETVTNADFRLIPGRIWKSPQTAGRYPVTWTLEIPRLDLAIDISPTLDAQELRLPPIAYWEGSISAQGRIAGRPAKARGYLEMTGYAGPIVGMTSESPSDP